MTFEVTLVCLCLGTTQQRSQLFREDLATFPQVVSTERPHTSTTTSPAQTR